MGDPFKNKPMPKPILYGAAGLALLSLGLTTAHTQFGFGAGIHGPGAVLVARSLAFADTDAGGIHIIDMADQSLVEAIGPEEQPFIRSLVRLLAKERISLGGTKQDPFELTLREGGYLSLHDPITGRTVELNAFGIDSIKAFSRLLNLPEHRS